MDMPNPSTEDAERFLDALGERHLFQIIRKRGSQRSKLCRGPASYVADLRWQNEHGSEVYVAINRFDGRRRKAEDAREVRAVVLDLDGVPLPPALAYTKGRTGEPSASPGVPPPHAIIETSPGHYHVWWFVEDFPLELFTPYQRALAKRFAGDPKVCDLPRVMRIPGMVNWKREEPFRVRIVELRADMPRYSANDGELAALIGLEDLADLYYAAEGSGLRSAPKARRCVPPASQERALAPDIRAGRLKRCIRYLSYLPSAISGEGGHRATFRAACECYRFGLDYRGAWEAITWFNESSCFPQWSEAELRHKLDDAHKRVTADAEFGWHLLSQTERAASCANGGASDDD